MGIGFYFHPQRDYHLHFDMQGLDRLCLLTSIFSPLVPIRV